MMKRVIKNKNHKEEGETLVRKLLIYLSTEKAMSIMTLLKKREEVTFHDCISCHHHLCKDHCLQSLHQHLHCEQKIMTSKEE